jgi:L,D-transpeptidase YcbB
MRVLLLPCLALCALWLPLDAHAAMPAAPIETAIRELDAGRSAAGLQWWDAPRWRGSIAALYAQRAFTPLWFSAGHQTAAADALIGQLRNVEDRGLIAADYDGERLAALAADVARQVPADPTAIARFDVALTLVAARLTSDLHVGRINPAEVGFELDIQPESFDVGASVAALALAPDVAAALDALEPGLRHYVLLKLQLARYRALARQPELAQLPPAARAPIRPGESYAGAPALRRLLAALGDLRAPPQAGGAEQAMMDADLVAALARFQARHGLEADGVLGPTTFRELTLPLDVRVQQIVLSLERMRWLPPKLATPPIIVNIPQFRLFAFRTTRDFAQDILQMDVIVGSAFKGRQTPVFAADMRYVVLHPYWDVPRSILLRELLPAIQRHPAWVTDHGYEMVRGEGDDAIALPATDASVQLLAQGALRLRQKPGPENALGNVKFMLPNRHNVYLHDTPGRSLFGRSRRAFSHGCIRVADPLALLAHVLRDDPTWTPDRLAEALGQTTPVRIALPRPIRVYIFYGTALATEAGGILFFDDLYRQDPRLARLLESRRTRAMVAADRGGA